MKYFLLLLVPVILFSSCDSMDVFADYDKETDFTQYKTYNFLKWPEQNEEMVNDIDKRRILTAISNEMELRGFTKIEGDADVMVNFILILEKKTGVQAYSDYYGGGYGGYYGYPMGYGHYGFVILHRVSYAITGVFASKLELDCTSAIHRISAKMYCCSGGWGYPMMGRGMFGHSWSWDW